MDDNQEVTVTIGELRKVVHESHRSSEVVGRITLIKEVLDLIDSNYSVAELKNWLLDESLLCLTEALEAKFETNSNKETN